MISKSEKTIIQWIRFERGFEIVLESDCICCDNAVIFTSQLFWTIFNFPNSIIWNSHVSLNGAISLSKDLNFFQTNFEIILI
jgi:hypothetical protein